MFYTNVEILQNGKIAYRGIDNSGARVQFKEEFNPTLFVKSEKPSKFETLEGLQVSPMKLPSIPEAKDFIKQYKKNE